MKTTLDFPDDLLVEAKAVAARRRTTLRDLVTRSLRREIQPSADFENPDPDKFEIGPLGLPVLKRRAGARKVTSRDIRRLEQACDDEDFQQSLKIRKQ